MEKLLARLKSFDLEKEVLSILKGEEAFIADRNQENLMAGIDSKGAIIGPPYAQKTINIKRYKGQPTDRVTLYDEGDFYKGFFISDKFPVEIRSSDGKTALLRQKYGNDITGLTVDKQDEVNKQILPEIIDKIKALF